MSFNKTHGYIFKKSGEYSVRHNNFLSNISSSSKLELGKPFSDTPSSGVLTVNAELVPLASPMFEPGPPGGQAVELARVVDRGLRESKAVDLAKLCLIPGKVVIVVFVDIYILNYDGNLIDASALAAIAALMNTQVFNYTINEENVEIKKGSTPLSVKKHPIAITFAKIGNELIMDPGLDEEQILEARITFTIDNANQICSIQKRGSGVFTPKQVLTAAKLAKDKTKELRKKLGGLK